MSDSPRIYVASLTDYNAMGLHGVWIDAAQEVDDIWDEINKMLKASPEARHFPAGGKAEEWAIHDYEGFYNIKLGESEDIEYVSTLGLAIEEHGEPFALWIGGLGYPTGYDTMNEYVSAFEDAYVGDFASVEDYAERFAEEMGWLKIIDDLEVPRVTFDAEGYGRDLQYGGDISAYEHSTGVYIFNTH